MATASEYVLEPIRNSAEFTIYRARQHGNPSPVLVVAPTAEHPLPQSLRRLEHEYSLAAELEPAWAAKPLALTRHEGRTILVLADPGGEPLDRVLERNLLDRHSGQPLDLARLLRLAINLATALGHAHQRGLIHKDVKPENVLVDDAGRVWLTGFGIASRLPRERQAPAPPEIIAGTLAYMSPEQTGRMNRSVDTRSDLYSLGVTLYQMLTGVLPFAAAGPLEWVHCHIARQAIAPVDRGAVPEPLSAVIMRLLAKNAEERYQTAAGLEADLRRCLSEWQSHGRIDPFPLGTDDSSDQLLIPEKLYGREREVDALLAAFDRVVAQGTAELVLVSGYSGVGKSSVVNELHKVLVPPRGIFAAGKFDQYKRDVPYATLAQGFQMLVRQILVKSEAEVDHWRHALLEALGPNGQLMVNLIPEVEFVIGKQPPVAELPPQEARGRFQLVFRRFFGAFARPEHPLALFLDDLQWLDTATLELLERLITDPDMRHVLLIGAYRDNEVSSSHPLMRTLAAIRNAGARAQEIVLAPLGLDDVERLIADALRCGPNSAGPLALLVHEKTGGNPFFAIQLLTALAEEGLLRFDRGASAWIWELDRIRAKGYSDNVVDLMLGKLRRLPHHTQTALQQLASLGNVAEIATLSMVFGQSEEEIHAPLSDAVRTGLILRLEGSYAFLHDRIQEAAYALIPESARAEVHLRIGRVLLASLTADGLAEHLFDVTNQLNRGASLLIDHDEKVRVAAINLRAGRKAKASAAYMSALAYFAAGIALLDETDWSSQYELMFNLGLELGECELLCGNSERAGQLIEQLLPRAASKVDEAGVYNLKVQLHVMKAENQQAVDSALTCLHGFGIDMPAHPTEEQVQSERDTLSQTLNERPIESLIDLPQMTDLELQAAMKVLSVLLNPAQFTDFRLTCFQACRMVTLSVQYGVSGDSASAYAYWGSLLGFVFHRYSEGYRFSKLACDVVEKHAFIANRASVYGGFGVVAAWTQPIGTAIDFSRTGIRTAIETGSPIIACYGLLLTLTYLLVRGDPLDLVWRESEMALDFARKARFEDAADMIVSQQRFIAGMQGRTATFSTFSDAQFDEATFETRLAGGRNAMGICTYWILKLKARFLSCDYTEALEAAGKAKPLLAASGGQIAVLEYFYYAALTASALYETASADGQQASRELLMAHREQLREWAENYPPTFADKLALVSAEIARLEKRDADALRLYEEAVHSAREHGFVQNEGLAHELAAQYYLAHRLETAGFAHLRSARNCYDRWGARGKVKQLDALYPNLHREQVPASLTGTIGAPLDLLDLATVIKVSQAISGEIVLEKLTGTLIRTAMEHAGAERALLILAQDVEQRIKAEATTSGDRVIVNVREAPVTAETLPESVLHYVVRTQENVILEDASARNRFSDDTYIIQHQARSILCLPLLSQAKLIGVLYLENNLTAHVFTAKRIAVLKMLASQASISLENTRLYHDLEEREAKIRRLVDANIMGIVIWNLEGGISEANEAFLQMVQYNREDLISGRVRWTDLTAPEWREQDERTIAGLRATGISQPFEREFLREDRSRVPVLVGAALLEGSGNEGIAFVLDLSEQKLAEEKVLKNEERTRLMLDEALDAVVSVDADGVIMAWNKQAEVIFGWSREDAVSGHMSELIIPAQYREAHERGLRHFLTTGDGPILNRRIEMTGLSRDGREFPIELSVTPLKLGQAWTFSAFIRDITERKRGEKALETAFEEIRALKDQLQSENIVLREEIDRASMFEEIVGNSRILRNLLSRVSKVAPTDSSVLITGETGTGKELIARAIHKRSRRSSRAFVSVNCAAIPHDLITSELFGHEKGAFTGATQRRLGRFELAEGGTVFLDEAGELPLETQVALLRVLQEHEFERVGGTGSIRTDVRVIAATNRDLEAAIAAGIFRSDLFYRLNVFPIEVPSLRERREDIPLLIEYFIDRYARKAGKRFKAVNKKSLDLLQSYPWPGNIRELQNVIERSVIVCETENFSVDESWLSRQPRATAPKSQLELSQALAAQEKEMIEAVLRETGGRVDGPSGAAARLGMPRSTLESKIKSLKVDKKRFKTAHPS